MIAEETSPPLTWDLFQRPADTVVLHSDSDQRAPELTMTHILQNDPKSYDFFFPSHTKAERAGK